MHIRTRLRTLAPVAVALAIAALAVPVGARQNVRERFTGFAINLNSGPRTATVDIVIDRWSSDVERQQLLTIITSKKDPTRC